MGRTRWTGVLACLIVPGLLSWLACDLALRSRGWIPVLTPWASAVAIVIGAVVLVCGLAVRRLRAHERTWMTPTGAATTAAAAQASVLCGSVLAGLYAGELVATLLAAASSPAMTQLAWTAGWCMVACLAWLGVGLLVEHWCAIDGHDDGDEGSSQGGGGGVRSGSQPA